MEKHTGWQHFRHEADIGIRGYGYSLEESFVQAAKAMTAVITEPELISPRDCFDVTCDSTENEYLFVDWLNVLVYEMSVRKMLFSQFDVQIKQGHLTAKVCGEKIDRNRHHPAVEIKGATLTELQVRQSTEGNWLAQCVVDV